MRTLKSLLITSLFGMFAYGQSAGGTVPFVSSLDITYGSGNGTALASISSGSYDAGYLDISDFMSAVTFDANDSCHVAVKVGSWTLPTAYASAGNKNSVTADSDFKILLKNVTAAGDDMNLENSFGSLVELTSSDQIMLRAKDDDGVQGDGFASDARIDLDWDTDPVGAYAITVTFTVTQQ